jgi:putative Ig domain-containing protein
MFRRKGIVVGALLSLLPLAAFFGRESTSKETPPVGALPTVSDLSPSSANQAPAIFARVIDSVRAGDTYDWQPSASDADGDHLTFSAVNLPPWASIDSNTGRITGTPAATDVGIYESITISVTDSGRHSTTSQPFSITVTSDEGVGVAALRWDLPLSKVNGEPLDDLAGYRILYGRSSDDLDKSVFVNDPAATSFEIGSLGSGIWYFAVVAVSASGLEGPPTTIASKSI